MVNVKDRYIRYKKAGGNFIGITVTGVSSLSKEFTTYPVYFKLEDSPQSVGEAVDSTIRLLLSTQEYGYVQGHLYFFVRFLFSSIFFHFDDLNTRLRPSIG